MIVRYIRIYQYKGISVTEVCVCILAACTFYLHFSITLLRATWCNVVRKEANIPVAFTIYCTSIELQPLFTNNYTASLQLHTQLISYWIFL